MMAKFKWRGVGMGLDGGQREYVLSARDEGNFTGKWYATIRYRDGDDGGQQWHLMMRDWETGQAWAPIPFTDIRKPPKEFVESLVLLAHNIGDTDG